MKNKLYFFQKIIIAVIFFIIAILLIFFTPLKISDELWNFQNIFKMSSGFIIYKDANVIITPIFFYLGNILFKILGANLIVFRIYNISIFFSLFFIVFRILKNLKVANHISLLYTSLIFLQSFSVVTAGANYNILAITFALCGINLYIIKMNHSAIAQGLISFLVFFTKQNIGIYYILATIIYELYLYKLSKKFFMCQIIKFAFFMIPSSMLLLKLYFDGVLLDFINYAFGGLLEFGQKNLSFSASATHISIFAISIFLYVFIVYKRKTILKDIVTAEIMQNFTLLIIFSILISFVIYPIANSAHFIFAIIFHLIFILYVLNALLINDLFGELKYFINTTWITIIIIFIITIRICFNYVENINTCSRIANLNSPFVGTLMYNEHLKSQTVLCDYIKQKNANGIDVIIFSYDSAITMIELNQSHGAYDLLFNGNLGYNGKERIKSDIINRENTEFLIVTNKNNIFEQEPPEIRDYIMESLEFEGKIDKYLIYKK